MTESVGLEIGLLAVLGVAGAASYRIMRRRVTGANGLWVTACVSLFASGACGFLLPQIPAIQVVGNALSTLYPALLLAGAIAYARGQAPAFLVPAALAIGATRALLAMHGFPEFAHVVAAVVEPAGSLTAAFFVYRATRARGTPLLQRALVPGLLAIAVLDLASGLLADPTATLSPGLLTLWALAVPLLLATQVAATSQRVQATLREAQEELEHRVEDRTAELARSVSELEREVTERRTAERALRGSEERYRIVSELSSDFSFAIRLSPDRSLKVEWITDAVQRVTGYEGHEFDGLRWIERIHPDDRERVLREIGVALAGQLDELRLRILHRSGEVRWVCVRFGRRTAEPDGSVRFVGAGQDITEQIEAEERRLHLERHVQEAQRLESLGVLAGGIAHDFNNVLTVILGNTRLAAKEIPENSPARPRLARIHAAADHASGLTEQMLTYSGKVSVELRPLDLSHLARELLDLLRASVTQKIQLDVELAGDLPPVEADPTQMRQVLLNLVSNASQAFGQEGGRIRIRTRVDSVDANQLASSFGAADAQPGDYVTLEVWDSGPGMKPAVQTRVFEPFYTTREEGRGLGLAAVLGIVTAHGGIIAIECEPGAGSRFRILLPPSKRRAKLVREPRPQELPLGGNRGTILVIDDDEWVLEIAKEFLVRAGFETLTAHGGEEAIELLKASPDAIEAVVLDLVMPGLSGQETLAGLRRIRKNLPVIVASGYDKGMIAGPLGREVASHLFKPYSPEDLVRHVREALGR